MNRKENEKASIIIPVYNAEKYLNRCLASVTNQSYRNLEIILVNDGSNDCSASICKKWAEQDERIIYIEQSNKGVSAARNAALEIVSGYYIVFIDSDDWIANDYLSYLISLLEKYDGEIAVCDFNIVQKEELLGEQSSEKINCLSPSRAEYELMLVDGMLTGHLWNKLFHKSMVENIKFNEEIFCQEDELFFHQTLSKCTQVVVSNQKKYYYFQHPQSALHQDYSERKFSAFSALEQMKENFIDEGNLLVYQEKYAVDLLSHSVMAVRTPGCKQRWYWLDILHKKMRENKKLICAIKRKKLKIRATILVFNKRIFYLLERGIWICKKINHH